MRGYTVPNMGQSPPADLNAVQAFVRVVEVGTFRGAAAALGLPKSTISRKVAELEGQLGAQLLYRTTRRVRPSEVGAAYHRRAATALAALDDAARGVDESLSEPRGLLRISLPVTMGQTMLGPLLTGFLRAYPKVQVAADVTDRTVDLTQEGFDLAIRAGALPDSSLVARKLAESSLRIVASPAYLRGRKPPKRPSDLTEHDCLAFPGHPGPTAWLFRAGRRSLRVNVTGRCSAGSFPALLDLAEAGLGVARLPGFMVEGAIREGRLVPLLDRYLPPPAALHVVYPAARIVPPKVRAFIDYLVEHAGGLLPPQVLIRAR